MNCRQFQSRFEEYKDGSLNPEDLAAAHAHLAGCAQCRLAAERNAQFTTFLVRRFAAASGAGVAAAWPRSGRILRELRARPAPSWDFRWLLLPLAAALVLCVVLLRRGPVAPPTPHVNTTVVSIHFSGCVPVHTFDLRGSFVIDFLQCQPQVVDQKIRLVNTKAIRQHEI